MKTYLKGSNLHMLRFQADIAQENSKLFYTFLHKKLWRKKQKDLPLNTVAAGLEYAMYPHPLFMGTKPALKIPTSDC